MIEFFIQPRSKYFSGDILLPLLILLLFAYITQCQCITFINTDIYNKIPSYPLFFYYRQNY